MVVGVVVQIGLAWPLLNGEVIVLKLVRVDGEEVDGPERVTTGPPLAPGKPPFRRGERIFI